MLMSLYGAISTACERKCKLSSLEPVLSNSVSISLFCLCCSSSLLMYSVLMLQTIFFVDDRFYLISHALFTYLPISFLQLSHSSSIANVFRIALVIAVRYNSIIFSGLLSSWSCSSSRMTTPAFLVYHGIIAVRELTTLSSSLLQIVSRHSLFVFIIWFCLFV